LKLMRSCGSNSLLPCCLERTINHCSLTVYFKLWFIWIFFIFFENNTFYTQKKNKIVSFFTLSENGYVRTKNALYTLNCDRNLLLFFRHSLFISIFYVGVSLCLSYVCVKVIKVRWRMRELKIICTIFSLA
jgi:hypothetical protein